MGNTEYTDPTRDKKSSATVITEAFVTWLNSYEIEEEVYVEVVQNIISECNARLEEEKADETSKD